MTSRDAQPRHALVVLGFLIALVVLVGGALTADLNMRRLTKNERAVNHSYEVAGELDDLLLLVADAETGQRGYLITAEEKYLAPYEDALKGLGDKLDRLRSLTRDDPEEQARLRALEPEIAAKLAELRRTVTLTQSGDRASALEIVRGDNGMHLMSAIRARVATMQSAEAERLARRHAETKASATKATVWNLVSTLAGAVLLGFVFALNERNLRIRARAASDVAEQREKLKTTLASIGDAVITTDNDGRVTDMNRISEDLTGWTTAEARGHALDDVFRIVNETTRVPVENPATRALREGVIVGLANHTVLVHRDGSERPIDDSAAPIRRNDGKVFGCVLVFRDVTERRRMEDEVAARLAAARFLAAIIESSGDAIVSKSLDGVIQSWNAGAEHLFGYTAEEAIGRHVSLIIPTERLPEEDHILGRIRAGERIDHFETVRLRKDGRPVHISLTVSPMRDESGRVVGASKIARDISERKESEARIYALLTELKATDRRKDEFLAILAHELRGPLAPLRNMLEVMKRSGKPEVISEARETMERQLGQLVRLVDDLIDVGRITRDRIELRKEQVDLASIVNQSVEACRAMDSAEGHRLTVSLPEEPVYLDADRVRLVQVLSNLVSNACKYTDPPGRVHIGADRDDGEVVVRVTDSGIGLTREQLARVFDMFTSVENTLERAQGGLGIGLTLAKRLVEMHGGTIEAHSEGRGKGSEFVVRLPAVSQPPKRSFTSPRTSTREAVPAPRSSRVLVVDDNSDSAASLTMLLDITGHETRIARDGVEAIEEAERFRPHVILLDIGLPRLNGFEACRRIRAKSWGKEMTLVALTGWGQEADRIKSKEAGFDHHMVKPVDFAELMKILGQRRPEANARRDPA